jgi:hypothetical protein
MISDETIFSGGKLGWSLTKTGLNLQPNKTDL